EFGAFQQIQPERGGVEVLDRYRLALRFLARPQSLRPDAVIPVALRAEVEHGAVRRPRRLACVVLDADPLRLVHGRAPQGSDVESSLPAGHPRCEGDGAGIGREPRDVEAALRMRSNWLPLPG